MFILYCVHIVFIFNRFQRISPQIPPQAPKPYCYLFLVVVLVVVSHSFCHRQRPVSFSGSVMLI